MSVGFTRNIDGSSDVERPWFVEGAAEHCHPEAEVARMGGVELYRVFCWKIGSEDTVIDGYVHGPSLRQPSQDKEIALGLLRCR